MARASFTLKRYLPLNTGENASTNWEVFNGTPGSGASTSADPLLSGAESFSVILYATSQDWVPAEDYYTLFFSGEFGVETGVIWKILGEDQGVNAGKFSCTVSSGGQTATGVSSVVVPFIDGLSYWTKMHFDGVAKTLTFYYAEDSESVPTSWTQIGTSQSMSALSSYTVMDPQTDFGVGIYDTDPTGTVGNLFNGIIYRLLITNTTVGITIEYFYYTGSAQNWTVPAGVTSVEALLWGGGNSSGQIYGVLSTTPGETLVLRVGGGTTTTAGGWPNGGTGGTGLGGLYALGGGGSSDIKRSSTYLLIAGGRGGTSNPSETNYLYGSGADGGSGSSTSYTGVDGTPNGRDGYTLSYGGYGGSQTAGGARGGPTSSPVSVAATAGSSMQGGNGCSVNVAGAYPGGGGGGGFYGGGGGGTDPFAPYAYYGNGGGGSCHADSSVSSVVYARRIYPWYDIGYDPPNQTYDRIPRIITDTTNGTTATNVVGPPSAYYDKNDIHGMIALRWVS